MHWGTTIIPALTWNNVLAIFTHPDAYIREYIMFHSVHTSGASWEFLFIEHIIYFLFILFMTGFHPSGLQLITWG
jgi:hypothetical protein